MCLTNAHEGRFIGISMFEIAAELERLNWEAEIRERELDRLFQRDRKIGQFFSRMRKIVNSQAEPEIKICIIASMLERGPIWPTHNDLQNPTR